MNTFKRKSLHAAVLAGLGAVGLAGAVQAQEVANVGRVFTYPYYTVPAAPAVAVEGKRSAEVLDFNLYLSPRDVWTGAVVLAGKSNTE